MKRISTLTKTALLIILALGVSYASKAATFTAAASGNWSNSATWGVTGPGVDVTGIDAIVIPVGITVTLDQSVTINNALATLTVTGSLTGNSDLNLAAGTLTGAGSVDIGTLNIGATGLITSTGSITVGNFTNSQLLLSLTSTINTTNVTLASGVLQLNAGGVINIANAGTINMAGGTFVVNGGVVTPAGSVNLTYSGTASTIGLETMLTGVQDITVNLSSSSSQISLTGALTVNGTLSVQQGTLNLNGNNLTVNGTIGTSATGAISSTASSNITIAGAGNVGSISFTGSGNTVGQFTLNTTGGGSLSLQSDLTVNGALVLTAGTLQVGSNQLTIGGAISGAGNIGTTINSSISLTGSGNVGTLTLTGGSMGNLSINLTSGGSVALGTNLTVNGSLSISNGTLALNGYSLVTNGTIDVAATGSIAGNVGSDITINGTGSVGSFSLSSVSGVISDLTINISNSGSVNLGSNVTVGGALTLQSGTLSLNGFNLTVNGTINSSGGGTITGNASSSITVSGTGNVGTITFATGGTSVNNLTVNVAGGGSLGISGNIAVGGTLDLTAGALTLNNGTTLTLNGTIAAAGSGTITGSASSNIIIGGTGNVGTLVLTSGSTTIGNLTVNAGGSGSVSLGSDVTVAGTLALSGGSLNLNGYDLTIAGTVGASGTGSISGNSASTIAVTGTGNVGTITLTAGSQTIGGLTINTATGGSVSLGSNATVSGTLALTSGTVSIGNFDLTVAGSGSLQGGSSSSYVITNGTGSLVMAVASAGAIDTFQVGTTTNFAPVIVTNNSTSTGNFSVNAHAGIFANGTTGVDLSSTRSTVNTSWNVESDITTGANVKLEMFWGAAMEVHAFNRAKAFISHYVNGTWDVSAQAQATAHAGGMYSVSRSGLTSFSPFAVFDNNTVTGVEDVKANANSISIFPNPANNYINVTVADASTNNRVRIFDAIGNEVLSYNLSNTTTSLDISRFSSGVYILSVNNLFTGRFIKK